MKEFHLRCADGVLELSSQIGRSASLQRRTSEMHNFIWPGRNSWIQGTRCATLQERYFTVRATAAAEAASKTQDPDDKEEAFDCRSTLILLSFLLFCLSRQGEEASFCGDGADLVSCSWADWRGNLQPRPWPIELSIMRRCLPKKVCKCGPLQRNHGFLVFLWS